jgi:hypothetical protein
MKALLPAALLSCVALVARGQESAATNAGPAFQAVKDVWILQMCTPPREYAVRLGSLQTVTLQEYDVRREGDVRRVVEMTVETTGGNQARFFWEGEPEPRAALPGGLEEKRREAEQAVQAAAGATDPREGSARVTKDYPVTTHSGWAEFKLAREGEVRDLHRQLMEMWTGRKREG